MKWIGGIIAGVAGLILLCLLILASLSVDKLVPFEQLSMQYDNTGDARIASGSLRVQFLQYPQLGIVALAWHYCPGVQLLTWCVEMESSDLRASGRVSWLGDQHLLLRNATLQAHSLEPFGLVETTASAQFEASVSRLELAGFRCPFSLEQLGLEGRVNNLTILGSAFGDLHLEGATMAGQQQLQISGSMLSASLQLDAQGRYSAEGELSAPAELEPLIRGVARHLGGQRYGWQLKGELPC